MKFVSYLFPIIIRKKKKKKTLMNKNFFIEKKKIYIEIHTSGLIKVKSGRSCTFGLSESRKATS